MAGNFGGHVRSERSGAGFDVTEVAIKSGKGRARADNAEVDRNTAGFAEEILGGIHELAAQAGALARCLYTEQAEVATVTAPFDKNAPGQGGTVFGKQEFASFHVGADAVRARAVACDEGLLDAESGVDQADEGVDVAKICRAEAQGIRWRERFGEFAHTRSSILTRISL